MRCSSLRCVCFLGVGSLWALNRQIIALRGSPPYSAVVLGPTDVAFFHQTNALSGRTNFSIRSVREHLPQAPYYLLSDGGPDFAGAAADFNISTFRGDGLHLSKYFNPNFTCQAHLQRIAEAARWASGQGATFLMIWEDDTRLLRPLRAIPDVDLNTMGNVANEHIGFWNGDVRERFMKAPSSQLAPVDERRVKQHERYAARRGYSAGPGSIWRISSFLKALDATPAADLRDMYTEQDMCWEELAITNGMQIRRNPEVQQITWPYSDGEFRGQTSDPGRNLRCLECLDGCKVSCGCTEPLSWKQSAWYQLEAWLASASVDAVVCDLPFGKQYGSEADNVELYPAALAEFCRVLRPGTGRAVLLTNQANAVRLAEAFADGPWQVLCRRKVLLGHMEAVLFLATRVDKAGSGAEKLDAKAEALRVASAAHSMSLQALVRSRRERVAKFKGAVLYVMDLPADLAVGEIGLIMGPSRHFQATARNRSTETKPVQFVSSISDSQASSWRLPPVTVGRSAVDLQAAAGSEEDAVRDGWQASEAVQERMPPWKSLWLVNYLVFLLVLNVEIVVPTADQYAQALGAGETFSGLVIALTPFFQGLIGIPLNYMMLRSGISLKNILIIMVAGSILGNILYALAGLMRSKITILCARTLIGVCQCQLGGPIYIAKAVGVKKRTKVLFIFSTMATLAFTAAPLLAALLETFVKELRIENLVLDSDTIPGWFMAFAYYLFLLKVVFFFENPEDAPGKQESHESQEDASPERLWTSGFLVCLFAAFASSLTNTMAIVFFVKLAEKTWGWSVSVTAFALAGFMAVVSLLSLISSRLAKLVEDRKGLQFSACLGAACSMITIPFSHSWPAAAITVMFVGLLLVQSCASVVKNYAYALAPKIVAPRFKDRASAINMILLMLGRGAGAQLGAILTSVGFAGSQLCTYLLLFFLSWMFAAHLKQHAKAT
ncbi:unnamed protein product [Symbiodinium natans]|uniref:Ribosomal RNA large subunit methyltransferase K/L-like methyltransferase domain-containing protein n=1 Tax=Symbiodinium natans TaxID=878477 RepID=A0A812UHX1_9DINO|nr:unnamed protein product [Symbiodinium natans]